MTTKPPMPAHILVEEICDDGADYNDGDHLGYAGGRWDHERGELVLSYEPDEDPEVAEEYRPTYGPTTRRFREVLP